MLGIGTPRKGPLVCGKTRMALKTQQTQKPLKWLGVASGVRKRKQKQDRRFVGLP